MDDNSQDAAHSIRRERVFGRRLLAFATVMIMVSTAFVALNVGATGDPMIWTSQDEYGPGEVVPIYGQGFAAFEDIVVEISHPDFDDRLYTVKPDVYGKFAFSEYVAEWVTSQDIPVNVTATQVVLGQTLVAYTEFFDPAAYIEGFTLKPVQRFTTGDIKGYNEGDSIPMMVVLNKNQLGGGSTVIVRIGFDYADINSPTNPIHGIDFLTAYNKNPPTPPYNTYPETTLPFWVSPSEGNLTDQHFVGYQDEVPSEGDNQQIGVWEFTLVFYANVQYAKVRFGAHLSVTDLSASFLGSSYFPGSALHVRLVSIDPSADEGNRDVPIALAGLLTPPQLTLEKSCTPTEVVYGDEITFEITWSNIGQAYANCIVLWDILPDQIDLDTSSFLMWTSENPTKMTPVPGPVVYGDWFEWLLGPMRGTGTDGALDPFVIHLSFTGIVNTGEQGCYENWAYLSYSDDHGGEFPDLEAYCTFCIKGQPDIEVEKTGPEYAHYGDTIEYTYTVTNTGEVDLVDVDVEDDVLGTIAEDDTLDVGQTKTYTVYHTVTVSDDDPLVNNVVAMGEDDYYRVVTDEDCWSVDILDPEITVTKYADLYCGEVGETIWYTIVVSNPSDDTDLYNVVVDDSLLGLLFDQGTLLAKQSKEFVVSFDVTEEFGDPMVNEVTATGEDLLGLEVSDYDSVDVDIKHPAIEITKEGSMECGIVGETVTYWINVTNPSIDTDMHIMVYDPMFSAYPLVEMDLPFSETWESGPLEHVISPNDADSLINTARVDAYDSQNHRLSKSATWTVDIYHPMIIVDKTASMLCAAEGDTVTYTITLTNPSTDTPLTFELYDDLFGGMIDSGDLDPKQTLVYDLDYLVPYITPDPEIWELYNFVYVDAWDPQDHYVGDDDECWVDIYHPDIVVEKTPNMDCAAEGDKVIYTIVVTNPTIDTPMRYDLYDSLLGGFIDSGTLAAGASDTYELEYTVPAIPADPAGWELYNLAYVDAWDRQDHYVYASDECWVDIYHPDIMIEKTANMLCAAEGDVVTYTITVTNPSIDTPMDYYVVDQLLGGTIGSGTLGPTESVVITEDYTVPDIPAEPREWELYNFVEVFALDPQDHEAYDSAECWVDIYHPEIVVDKWADLECAAEGDTVIYTIVVTNPTIDTPMSYNLNDPLLGGFIYSGYLLPGGSDTYKVPYDVPAIPADPQEWELYNFVEVFALDPQDHEAYDSADCRVDIYHPEIVVDKSADMECAAEGDVVTYTIVVTNPTSDTPMYCEIIDPLFADQFKDGGIIDQKWFEPGESMTYTIEYTVPYIAPDPFEWELYNMVEVWAWDPQDHFVLETDFWLIDIYHPGIVLEKTVDMTCAAEGETIWFTLTVTNPTAETPMYYDLFDPLLGGQVGGGYLLAGASDVYDIPYVVPETPMIIGEYELYNFAYVEAWDPQLHEAYDSDDVCVDVVHPSIEITKFSELTCAHDDETIEYVITVTNTGDTWLNGTVYDDLLGLSVPFKDLRPGETIDLYPDYTVPVGSELVINDALVEAWDHQDHRVTADASWTVEILHPEIDVEKTGPEYANAGDVITYTVVVTNTGDTELFNVDVVDSLVGSIAYYSTLAIDETHTITYTYEVPSGEGILYNEVEAWGWDRQDVRADDWDSWEVMKYSKIVASKFADLNQNGVWSDHEPGVESWVIDLVGQLDDGTWDNRTRLTDSSGYFEFTNLQAGVYTVTEAMVTGWQSMTTTSYTLTVGSGTLHFCTFGNVPLGTISGSKWWDSDLDGFWDEGEEGIEGWTISLMGEDANGDHISMTTTTDENGDYTFDGLLPGLYTVYEEDRDGWYPTTASSVIVDTSITLDTFTVIDVDFGNAKYGSISGYKWLDEYMNGYWDGDELRLEGWTIWLEGTQVDGTPVGPISTTTDEFGNYVFVNLLPGVYTVWEELPDGWYAVTPVSREITLIEGSEVTCAKFGNVEYGSISGWKFLDWDMDGMMDGDEPGIPGWAITLTGWLNDGALPYPMPGWTDTATIIGPITIYTDANGYWEFPDLLPGVYVVTEEDRDDWYNTLPQTVTLIVRSGSDLYDIKFGNVPYTCLWGFKYEDLNGNGEWDEGEPGLPGWTIVVEGCRNDGVPVHIEMVTDQDGYWATCYNVLPGTYVIYELPQEGWVVTTMPEYRVPMQMCMEPMDYYFEFGNFELGKIWGFKYEDMNGNGILDDGDVPIRGWTIYLDGPVYGQTTTDENGYYEFTGLTAGMYWVWEESLGGWVHTSPASYELVISSGDMVEIPVFLNVELSRISGYKFNDLNSNGVWDKGEPGIEDWTIYMVWDKDPTTYSTTTDENGYYEFTGLMPDLEYVVWEEERDGWTPTTTTGWIISVVSGSDICVPDFGNFENVDITVFKYEDMNSNAVYDEGDMPLCGWEFIVTGPGITGSAMLTTDSNGYASVEVTAAGQYVVEEVPQDMWCPTTPPIRDVFVQSGFVDPEVVMFGNFHCVEITIFKYEDVNSNGIYDDGDEPLSGWEFTFYGVDRSSFVMETDMDGLIHVTFCDAGYWDIVEEMPDDWCPVNPSSGMVSIWVQSGMVLNLGTQAEQYLFEFGNFHCFELTIFKYLDSCSNGYYDPDLDEPLEGWYFEIIGPSYPDGAYGWTDEYGMLSFTICKAGTYTVTEEDREGWSHIEPLSGSYEIYVESGEEYIELWFANYEDVDVPIFKYEDVNSNGVWDEGEDGVEGWYFELIRNDDMFVYSGYTDENGMLVLTVNRSGVYTLVEEDKEGWTHVNPETGMRLVSIVSGIEVPLQMFGNFHDVTILVFKFDDIYGDGRYSSAQGDVPIAGWMFELYMLDGDFWVLVDTQVTDGDGLAMFVVNQAGTFKVLEESREGWIHIMPFDGYYIIDVESGMDEIELCFANFKLGMIFGWKWNDLNGNGEWDEGEPGLPGWTIHMEGFMAGYGYLYAETTTDENGYYQFTGLPPGDYIVWEDGQTSWIPTSPAEVELCVVGHSIIRVDFLNFELGCIEGYKYEDMNGNGIFDDGDTPIEDWTIYLAQLFYSDEHPEISGIALIDMAMTDENGHYMFCGLGPGTYVVSEESREGWIATTDTSETVDMTSGAMIVIHDFLNFELGMVCGWKFEDLNSNGVWDKGEQGLPNWPIHMIRDATPEEWVVYTDSNGYFCISGLTADWYMLWEEILPGWTPTTYTWAEFTITSGAAIELDPFGNFKDVYIPLFKYEDMDGDGNYNEGDHPIEGWMFTVSGPCFGTPVQVYTNAEGKTGVTVTMAGTYLIVEEDRAGWMHVNPSDGTATAEIVSGMMFKTFEFGNFMLGQITGQKFYDWNANGIMDQGEPGLANWVIWINGTLVSGEFLDITRLTDSNGLYSVTGLPAGTYVVSERLEYGLPGWYPTTPATKTVVVNSGTISSLSFGNVVYGVIQGWKFYDKDMDGVFDENEVGLSGWTIVLEGYTDQGVYVYRTTTTVTDGSYVFDQVQPGEYTVTEVLQETWESTTALPVVVDTSGLMEYFDVGVDIGNIRYALIHGYKFLDTYSECYPFWPNGLFDEGEYGLGNWEITLEGWTTTGDHVQHVVYTDNMKDIGYYEFDDVLPGTYWVNETLLWGFYATKPISNLIMVYPFPQGPVEITIDFGNAIPEADPELRFVLSEGWNLWSCPMEVEGLTAMSLLEAIGPTGLAVSRLSNADDRYYSYSIGESALYDFSIVRGVGYFVYVTSDTTFLLRGEFGPANDAPLGEGWNIVGFSQLKPVMASEFLSMVEGGNALVVSYLDKEDERYYSYVLGEPEMYDFVVSPGRAYFIWVDADATLVF